MTESSSSSGGGADPYADFYLLCPRLTLQVENQDGVTTLDPGGVVLRAGSNFELILDEETDEIRLNAGAAVGVQDPYYQEKYDALAGLTSANDALNPVTGPTVGVGPTWAFTRLSMWLATLNNALADEHSGAIFLNHDACSVAGEFDLITPTEAYPELVAAELSLLDICVPCRDCGTWGRLSTYLTRLRAAFDYMFELVYNDNTTVLPTPPTGLPAETFNGLYWQWLATQRMWDYLVHASCAKFSAQGQGQSIVAAGYYRNITDGDVGDPIRASVTFVFTRNGVIWEGIDAAAAESRWLARNTTDHTMISDVANPDEIGTYYLKTYGIYEAAAVASSEVVYADVALLINDSRLPDELQDFRVYVIFELTPTHLIDDNVIDWGVETWEWVDILAETGGPTGRVIKAETVYFVPREATDSSS